eukprot:COSAG02_NODE_26842_length_622_cov_2.822180_1_plen_27_part_01
MAPGVAGGADSSERLLREAWQAARLRR